MHTDVAGPLPSSLLLTVDFSVLRYRCNIAGRLWDWQRNSEAALLTTTAGLPTTVKAPLVMCRSCCFSPDKPDLIFSVQSGQRGSAYVTTWRYSIGEADGGGRGLKCTVEPIRVACVSKHPATTLAVRSDGARLAVGNVEGTVLIYRLPGFAKVGGGGVPGRGKGGDLHIFCYTVESTRTWEGGVGC